VVRHSHYLACVSAASLALALYAVPAAAARAPAAATDQAKQQAEQASKDAPASGTAATANSAGDTKIVITAQKRSENVQKVPISVAAFS